MQKMLFDADRAEEYFSDLCTYYRNMANEIFARDNEGRHASEQIYSAEYQKYVGMQIAMKEVLEYFSKYELPQSQETKADRVRAQIATDEGLVRLIFKYNIADYIRFCEERPECMEAIGTDAFDPYGTGCQECLLRYLRQPAEVDDDGEA